MCAAEGSGSAETISRAAARLGLGGPAALDRLAGLAAVEGTAVVFHHPLLRSAVYYGAGQAERRAVHSALAATLEGDETQADRRAWHLAKAAIGPDEPAAAELERSADQALRRSGHSAAAAALARAAELSPGPGQRARRLAAAADAAWRGGDAPRAMALMGQAERLPVEDVVVALRMQHLRARIELRSGIPADALALLLPAAAEAATADPHLAVCILVTAGEAAFLAGDAQAMAETARMLEVLPQLTDPRDALLARMLREACTPGGTAAGPGGALDRLADLDDPDLLSRAAGLAFGRGRYALARRLRIKAVDRARGLGAAATLAGVLRSMAMDEIVRSRYAFAEAHASEGRSLAAETRQPNLACQHQAMLAEIAATRGHEDQARSLAAQTLAEATARGLHGVATQARRALIDLALATGRPGEALSQLEAQWTEGPAAHRKIALAAVPDLAEAAVRAGCPELAEQHLASYQDWAESAAAPEATALAARSRALLTEGAGAGVLYRQALQAHAVTERPMDQARTALLYGEYLRRQRRRAEARALLRAAVDAFERIGAPLWAARARAELRAAGETTAPRSPASLDRLTPQELQVARLVSQGMTNRGAAAQLFISPRTVDHHLRSVFRKLGIASRAELIRHIVATDGNSPAPQPRIPAGTHHPGRLALCSSSPFGHRWGVHKHVRDVPPDEVAREAAKAFGG